jgi:hypothetical protein
MWNWKNRKACPALRAKDPELRQTPGKMSGIAVLDIGRGVKI